MDVNMDLFGQYDITGVKDADGEPCPRTWDPHRQYWNDEWKEFLYEQETKMLEKRYKELDYRLREKCENPNKVIDIVNAGIADPNLATNAIAEVLEQLYN